MSHKSKLFVALIILGTLVFSNVSYASFNDVYYKYQKWIDAISYSSTLVNRNNGSGVVVAVIDSGVWQEHPELRDAVWINNKDVPNNNIDDDNNGYKDDYYGWNFIHNNADLAPKSNHGTAVAGIIAAQHNSEGIAGIAPGVKIMSLIVCDKLGCINSGVKEAIKYAADNGADVINLSLGSQGYLGYSDSFNEAIKYAYDRDVVIVSSAGNGDPSGAGEVGQNLGFIRVSPVANEPENINMILGVGAKENSISDATRWSNYGYRYIDTWAPGKSILSTAVPIFSKGSSYKFFSGTSFSAPMVSATAALLKSRNPNLRNYEIIDIIKSRSLNFLNISEILNNLSYISCKINSVTKRVKIGESVILNGLHLNPKISLKLGSEIINNAVTILDANKLSIDTSKIDLPNGKYILATTDLNVYCQLANTSIELYGDSNKTKMSPPPKSPPAPKLPPPPPDISKPKKSPPPPIAVNKVKPPLPSSKQEKEEIKPPSPEIEPILATNTPDIGDESKNASSFSELGIITILALAVLGFLVWKKKS